MRIEKSSNTCAIVTVVVCALINGAVNAYIITSYCFDDSDKAMTGFGIAWGVWQLANIVISVYCMIDKSVSNGLRLYLQVSTYLVGVLGLLILIGAILGWSILHCVGDYCPIWDFLFGFLIFVDLCVNLCGFIMMLEAYKISLDVKFAFQNLGI